MLIGSPASIQCAVMIPSVTVAVGQLFKLHQRGVPEFREKKNSYPRGNGEAQRGLQISLSSTLNQK